MNQSERIPETAAAGVAAADGSGVQAVAPPLPLITEGAIPDIRWIRDERENVYLAFILLLNGLVFAGLLFALARWPRETLTLLLFVLPFVLLSWIGWKLLYSLLYGHSVRVGPNQYPHLHRLFVAASQRLGIHEPVVLVLHGQGLVELLLAKRFTRRGVIILTSNLFDSLKERPSSRELMMVIGIQLGHIMAGHYRFWFLKDVIGSFAIGFHAAWKRRCMLTADRIGLLVAGDLYSAQQGLLVLTVGDTLAAGTNLDEIREQREELFDSVWTWIRLLFDTYPFLVDRLVSLEKFCARLESFHELAPARAGAIRLDHQVVRSAPIFIIHGHDRLSLLELKNFLFTKFPNVMPLVMAEDPAGAFTLPEKLETVAAQVYGAIALVTPDDAIPEIVADAPGTNRARQNVVLEIGWFWARLGRQRCLLLRKGQVDLPSDLAGVEWHDFERSPTECSENIREFLGRLEPAAPVKAMISTSFGSG